MGTIMMIMYEGIERLLFYVIAKYNIKPISQRKSMREPPATAKQFRDFICSFLSHK